MNLATQKPKNTELGEFLKKISVQFLLKSFEIYIIK